MPAPLDPDKRAAIIAAIKGGNTRNGIARMLGVAQGTVTLIAQQEGIDDAFDRSASERATEAARLDMAAWRANFAKRLALRADLLEDAFDGQQTSVMGGKEGAEVITHAATSTDVRNLMTALGIAVDKIAVLTRDDNQGVAAVDAWLHSLGVGQTQP